MDGPKPYKFIGFGAMSGTKPYEFIWFGAMDVTKPYEFIGFGAIDGPKPYKCMGFLVVFLWLPTGLPILPGPGLGSVVSAAVFLTTETSLYSGGPHIPPIFGQFR